MRVVVFPRLLPALCGEPTKEGFVSVLEAYHQHVEERAAQGVPPLPLNAQQTAALITLLKNPPADEEATSPNSIPAM